MLHHDSRAATSVEMVPIIGSDREALRALGRQVTRWRLKAQLNKKQIGILASRLGVVLATLLAMQDSAPSPQLLSVVRSGEFLLRSYALGDKADLLMQHFAGRHLFAALRERYEKVWSLHSTALWDSEDHVASATDEDACVAALRELQTQVLLRLDERFGEGHATAFFRRRGGISGWKLPRDHLRFRPSEIFVSSISESLPSIDEMPSDTVPDAARFTQYTGVYTIASSAPVVVFELPPRHVGPEQLDAFLVDVAHRHSWYHPCLVPLLGAYTEAVDEAGHAYLVLGAVMRDLVFHGWEPLADRLFLQRRRPALHVALNVCLQVADALQYVLFDAPNVPPAVVTAWCSVSPSAVFIREVADDDGDGDGDAVLPHEVDYLFGDRCVQVTLVPQLHIVGQHSRWAPPPAAMSVPCYTVAALLMAMLTACPAHVECSTQLQLREAEVEGHPGFPAEPPPFVPSHLRSLCAEGLAVAGGARRGFDSLQHMRRALLAARGREAVVYGGDNGATGAIPDGALLDFGT